MMETIGTIFVWIVGILLTAIWPLSEFARMMASNPDQHPISKTGCLLSIIGLIIIATLIYGGMK